MIPVYKVKVKNVLILAMLTFGIQLSAQDINISQNELPQGAKNFLDVNFKNQEISSVIKESDNSSKIEFEVYLKNQTKIEFDKDGNWKEVESRSGEVPQSFISAEILQYLKQNYPNETIVQIEKSNRDIEVELKNGLELDFDLNGKFLKIDDR